MIASTLAGHSDNTWSEDETPPLAVLSNRMQLCMLVIREIPILERMGYA